VTDASGDDVPLTPTESRIVEVLARRPGILVPQQQDDFDASHRVRLMSDRDDKR